MVRLGNIHSMNRIHREVEKVIVEVYVITKYFMVTI